MATSTLCLAASGIIRDVDTNVISAFNILEQITPQGFPFLLTELNVLGVWKKDGDEEDIPFVFRVTLNGAVLHEIPNAIHFGNSNAYRSIVKVIGTMITGPGTLKFEYIVGGHLAGFYEVQVLPPPGTAVIRQ